MFNDSAHDSVCYRSHRVHTTMVAIGVATASAAVAAPAAAVAAGNTPSREVSVVLAAVAALDAPSCAVYSVGSSLVVVVAVARVSVVAIVAAGAPVWQRGTSNLAPRERRLFMSVEGAAHPRAACNPICSGCDVQTKGTYQST